MAAALLLLWASAARAEAGAEVSIANDYRYRGVSLTGGRPAGLIDLDIDARSGLYASALVAIAPDENDRLVAAAERAVAGFARPLGRGIELDTGLDVTAVRAAGTDVTRAAPEAFVGLRAGGASLYAAYSPSYYGGGSQTVYLDATVSVRPASRLHLFARAGLLTYVAAGAYGGGNRADFAVGAVTRAAGFGLRAEIDTASRSALEGAARTALVVTITRGF